MSYMIKDLPTDELPREKAKKLGFSALSNVDLLSILLRTGTKNCSVKDLALNILSATNGLKGMDDMRISKLSSIRGVGEVKAITLLAAIELGKRSMIKDEKKKIQIRESKDVYYFYSYLFEREKQEKFFVLFLNSKNEVLDTKVIFMGTVNQSFVHPRDIFQEAILNNAVKILCVHNHPTGNTNPSIEDEQITKNLIEAGKILNIPVIDHIIFGNKTYYSFLEHGKV